MADVIDNGGKTLLVQRDNDNYHRGLEGKDAAFLGTHFNALADRHLTDCIRDEGRHGVDTTHITTRAVELAVEKTAAANALAISGAELRLSKEILKEACETRALINSVDANRIRDALTQAQAELLALRVSISTPVTI